MLRTLIEDGDGQNRLSWKTSICTTGSAAHTADSEAEETLRLIEE
jgi:hypothetical protein